MQFSDKEELKASLRWMLRQREAEPFFDFLDAVIRDVKTSEDTCALHRHDERRKFAANLIAMAEADKSDGQDQGDSEQERRNASRVGTRKSRRHGPSGRGR